MIDNPIDYHRRSIRLKCYDYSLPGGYFITITTYKKEKKFGEITQNRMILNSFGNIAESVWLELPKHFPNLQLDEFIVMPNHLHGIIMLSNHLSNSEGILEKNEPSHIVPTIGNIIGSYKSRVVHYCLNYIKQNNSEVILGSLWQRNYYERVIRDYDELNRVREYIVQNPSQWDKDEDEDLRDLFNK